MPTPSAPATATLLLTLLAAGALAEGLRAAPQVLPERPAVHREVTGILDVGGPLETDHDARFQRPHVPAYRTTRDGRLAMSVEHAPPSFSLIVPEKLSGPVLLQAPGAFTSSWSGSAYAGGDPVTQDSILTGGTGRRILQTCLWDDALPVANAAGQDVYHIKALATTIAPNDPGSLRFFVTPLRVVVDRPKTAAAAIVEITPVGPTQAGPDYKYNGASSFNGSAFEPTIAGDGRLIVFRVASSDVPTPSGPIAADIVYSYYEDPTGTLGPANPAGWTEVLPIAHAHYDARLNGGSGRPPFGFAIYPLTDAAGNALGPWEDLGATYPWIDREAKNLFFTTIGDTLHFQDLNPQYPNRDPRSAAEWRNTRYESVGVPGDPRERWGFESRELFQGAAFAGLWTHGRMVLADNLLNDMDYAIGSSRASTYGQIPYNVGPQQRLVRLFAGSPLHSLDPASGWVRLGYGRANDSPGLPDGENANSTIIDSLENKLAYRAAARPLPLRDVVWNVSNGKHTDEVVFDEHLDPDALIVADMVGLLTFPSQAGPGFNNLEHHSGWDSTARAFAGHVRLQNAATYTERWLLPPFGELRAHGSARGRLEPAALGGVRGKGLWLEDGVGLVFAAPSVKPGGNPRPSPEAFYAGLFVDCRFDDDGARRSVLRFPDGSALELLGRSQVLFTRGIDVLHRTTLPASFQYLPPGEVTPRTFEFLPRAGWTHLGLRIEERGRRVTLLVNGFPAGRYEHPTVALFQPLTSPGGGGELVVGGPPSAAVPGEEAFRGWVDELRLLAHDVDPESAANHAGGTLIGFALPGRPTARHTGFAESYPAWIHAELAEELRHRGEPARERYAVVHDYTRDKAVHAGALPMGTEHLRAAFHFPEGPVFQDRPRPDSTSNTFCTTCHHTDGAAGLSLAALEHRPLLARLDARRQPSQPPALVGGVVPDYLVDAGPNPGPAPGARRPPAGVAANVDQWLLPRMGRRAALLQSITVLDAATGRTVGTLEPNANLDPAVLGSGVVDVRANLDVGQGSVDLQLNERTLSGALVVIAQRKVPHGAARLFGPQGGFTLLPGAYELTVTPEHGARTVVPFTVVDAAPRAIARVREGFREVAPARGWSFLRSRGADVLDVARYVPLAYDRVAGIYDETGLWGASPGDFGSGHLHATGGRPGPGTTQAAGGGQRALVVGFTARRDGHYLVRGVRRTSTSGGAVAVHVAHEAVASGVVTPRFAWTTGAGAPTLATGPVHLVAGDVLWIVAAPGASNVGDDFTWDPWIEFSESSWIGTFD